MTLLHPLLLAACLAAGATDSPDDQAAAKASEAPPSSATAGLEARVADMERRLSAAERRSADGGGWSIEKFPPLKIESADGDFEFEFGGRIQADLTIEDHDPPHSGPGEGAEFRRARLFAAGKMYGNVAYKAQYDLAGNGVSAKDVWLALKGLGPAGSLKVGHFKEPFGLEELTSSKYITFLERSVMTDGFAPSRNLGAQLSNTFGEEASGTWAVGVFKPTGGSLDSIGPGMWSGTGRVTWLLVDDPEKGDLVHLGLAGSLQSDSGGAFKVDAHPEAHLLGKPVSVSVPSDDGARMLGAEAAWVHGPWSLQGEAQWANIDNTGPGGDPNSYGYYVEGSWWPTGGHRSYKRSSGTFGRPKIESVLGKDGSFGAHQFAVRYSSLMAEVPGGPDQEMMNVTAGWNWYWNSHTRFMVNYVHSHADDGTVDGDADIVLLRWQIDF